MQETKLKQNTFLRDLHHTLPLSLPPWKVGFINRDQLQEGFTSPLNTYPDEAPNSRAVSQHLLCARCCYKYLCLSETTVSVCTSEGILADMCDYYFHLTNMKSRLREGKMPKATPVVKQVIWDMVPTNRDPSN